MDDKQKMGIGAAFVLIIASIASFLAGSNSVPACTPGGQVNQSIVYVDRVVYVEKQIAPEFKRTCYSTGCVPYGAAKPTGEEKAGLTNPLPTP